MPNSSGVAKYYVVYEPGRSRRRPWVVMVSSPYAKGEGGTNLRRFKRKRYAVKKAKQFARNNNERVAVNRKDGATTRHYDYT